MSGIAQEKFQAILPGKIEAGKPWVSAKSTWKHEKVRRSNEMPPGMNLAKQRNTPDRDMPMSLAGRTDVTDDVGNDSLHRGYSRKQMRPTDDMYTNEHVDAFYGEAKVDGEVGFVERNNMLDRL
jgi:hypothetical protein